MARSARGAKVTLDVARDIMGTHLIGVEELARVARELDLPRPEKRFRCPVIPFSRSLLEQTRRSHLLVLGQGEHRSGAPLTLVSLRSRFGIDPANSEPCFYNQDWYLRESFACRRTVTRRWHLIAKKIAPASRGLSVDEGRARMPAAGELPTAVLAAYTFFLHYFLMDGELLWEHDFLWCADKDVNGDQIYVGRYRDPKGINKNGFNIHRHLSIKRNYGIAAEIIA